MEKIPAEKALFLHKFLHAPKQVGSITPSSRFLTRKMMQCIDWTRARAVAEFGAGTGVFTRAIHAHKRADCRALIFEQDLEMRSRLAARYPDMDFCADAGELTAEMNMRGIERLDAIVSGLPFANFKAEVREKILSDVVKALQPDGVFVMFQYSLQMKKHLQARFSRVEVLFVPWNVPPAVVYVCRK